jgi:holliday junction DNA helicase RuvA
MIGRLKGVVMEESPDGELILDVHGVGYELRMPLGALGRVPQEADGSRVVYVHTAFKQEGLDLFGFASLAERAIFRALVSVPNVGPRTAIAILGSVTIQDLAAAVESGDVVRLSKVPGIGKKTAERLIVELKGKLAAMAQGSSEPRAGSSAKGAQAERLAAALISMGYRAPEAGRAVEALGDAIEGVPPAEALRQALALLSRR